MNDHERRSTLLERYNVRGIDARIDTDVYTDYTAGGGCALSARVPDGRDTIVVKDTERDRNDF